MIVKTRGNNVEGALKVLKRKLKENDLFQTLKQREHFEKPSEKRNRKKAAAKLREQRRQGLK